MALRSQAAQAFYFARVVDPRSGPRLQLSNEAGQDRQGSQHVAEEIDWGFKLDDKAEEESTATDPTVAGGALVLPRPRGPTTEEKLRADELARREAEAKREVEIKKWRRRRAAVAAVVGGLLSMIFFMIAAMNVGLLMIFFGVAGGFLAWLVVTYRLSQLSGACLYGLVQVFILALLLGLGFLPGPSGMLVHPAAFFVFILYMVTGKLIALVAELARHKTENPY